MKVIGIQRNVNFKIEGRDYTGISIYTSTTRDNVEGVVTEKFFIGSTKECYQVASQLKLGDNIQVGYNRYGKVDTIFLDNEVRK